jgi:hypothetical protein
MKQLEEMDEEKKESMRKFNRRKHWPLNVEVQIPNRPENIKMEVQSSIKVKRFKDQISDKIGGEVKSDRMKL